MARKQKGWFGADRKGLGQMNEHRPKSFIVKELVQNVKDEHGVTLCHLDINPVPGKVLAHVICEDDAPEGFSDLSHAFTLYRHTNKRKDPTKAGRFNLGEKQVLSLAKEASITTTTGTVIFHADDTREEKRAKREAGSVFFASIPMTREEIAECIEAAKTILMPERIDYRVNGEQVPHRKPLRIITDVTLQTEFENDEGQYRKTRRKTYIEVYLPDADEQPMIYELGIPVMPTGDKWSYNIGQRVPLNSERDNIQPSFLQDVRSEVLNVMIDNLEEVDASDQWVRDAASDARIKPETVRKVADKRWGVDRMVLTPGDSYGREKGIAKGYHVVSSREMSADEWAYMREAKAVPASSAIFKRGVAASRSLPRSAWTQGMKRVEHLTQAVSRVARGFSADVSMVESPENTYAAWYRDGHVTFNVSVLGRDWFDKDLNIILELIIHELGHEFSSNHLSEEYYGGLCKIGAAVALVDPAAFLYDGGLTDAE